jgi:RIO kinase 1
VSTFLYDDTFDEYEDAFNARQIRRAERRPKKLKPDKRAHDKPVKDIIGGLSDDPSDTTGFSMTYQPSQFEAVWLKDSLHPLFDKAIIMDVLASIKGGKEASVYRCEAHPATGAHLVAAKVYRPRMFRNLRNDAMYKEGRAMLNSSGKLIKESDMRVMKALAQKSTYGDQVAHTSWLMHEMNTLNLLYEDGARVPRPYGTALNAIAMDYIGDEHTAAPPLSHVTLDSHERTGLFVDVMRTVDTMLKHRLVHGDLSAFNILYWRGQITVIDFPQVVSIDSNSVALKILERDVQRVCEYFADQGVTGTSAYPCDPVALMDGFRRRHFRRLSRYREADFSRATLPEDVED